MKPTSDRFTNTVDYYSKYRPSYPEDVLNLLLNECQLSSSSIIADIGSGTGLLSCLFLKYGCTVFCVEPNEKMRESAEHQLCHFPNFHNINGSAEATTLPSDSIDIVTAGTAFHWFDRDKARNEFLRILKNNGYCVLIWNLRAEFSSPMMAAYENLLRQYGTDFNVKTPEKIADKEIFDFFGGAVNIKLYSNHQVLNEEGLIGRLLSTSYVPKPGQANFNEMLDQAHHLFRQYQIEGHVEFIYSTKCYYGMMKKSV